MSSILNAAKLWGLATISGIFVIFLILKRCFIRGFGKVFSGKRWSRPKCLDDPSLGTHGYMTLEDVRIHYVASGPENKPLMLFVHGYPEFWYSWRHQIREFQKDYRVVAIDMRGYSESSRPAGIENYTMSKLMSDLKQVIHAQGYKSCILVAHDWGGVIAWPFSRYYPELVDKLIIMNAPPSPVFRQVLAKYPSQRMKSWYIFLYQLPFLPEIWTKMDEFVLLEDLFRPSNKSAQNKTSDEDLDAYKYTFSQPGALTSTINYYRAMYRYTPQQTVSYDLEYTMPVLLIWGCQDIALEITIPDMVEKVAPKIEVKRIPNGSHFVQTDAPDDVNKIMREWLNKQ